jgi:hypothetical protein
MLHQLRTYIYARNGVEWRSKGCTYPQKAYYELKWSNMSHKIQLVSHVASGSRCAITTSSLSPPVRSCLRAKDSFFLSFFEVSHHMHHRAFINSTFLRYHPSLSISLKQSADCTQIAMWLSSLQCDTTGCSCLTRRRRGEALPKAEQPCMSSSSAELPRITSQNPAILSSILRRTHRRKYDIRNHCCTHPVTSHFVVVE